MNNSSFIHSFIHLHNKTTPRLHSQIKSTTMQMQMYMQNHHLRIYDPLDLIKVKYLRMDGSGVVLSPFIYYYIKSIDR